MDIQDPYLDIQLCDKHLTYSVLISKYSAMMSKIFILTYFNIFDSTAECSDITTDFKNACHIVEYPFFSV